jgi:Pyrimidine 5'-nucleotidase (UMPH-1)
MLPGYLFMQSACSWHWLTSGLIDFSLFVTDALEVSKLLPPSYSEQALAMEYHYYPIEIDPDMSIEEKIPYMVEWYE